MIFKQFFANRLSKLYLHICTSHIFVTIIVKGKKVINLRGSKGEGTKAGLDGGDMGEFGRRKGKEKYNINIKYKIIIF